MKKVLIVVFVVISLILVARLFRSSMYSPQYYKAVATNEANEAFSALGSLEASLVRYMLDNNGDCSAAALNSLDIDIPPSQNYSFAIDQKNCAVTATRLTGKASGTVFTKYAYGDKISCSGDNALCAAAEARNLRN
ncbi:MAG: hypothetical protein LBL61_04955 [Elusimicrobiota bacterium]|jgi:hypothetical protein|nr:hypothetical protein [Elusimicrobiota bacterium]